MTQHEGADPRRQSDHDRTAARRDPLGEAEARETRARRSTQREYEGYSAEVQAHYAKKGVSRREAVKRAGFGAVALGAFAPVLAGCGLRTSPEEASASVNGAVYGKALKGLGTNGGLGVMWYAQGKSTIEQWAKLLNVDLTWVDGELDPTKQRAKLDNAAIKTWDIAMVTATQAGTVLEPLRKIVDKGADVVQMTSNTGKPGEQWGYLTFTEQSSYDMGYQVTKELCQKAGGKGTIIETRGPAPGTDQQDRHKGFEAALKEFPDMELLTTDFANWDSGTAQKQWDSYLTKYPEITVGYCQNDDMALAALQALKSARRTGKTLIGGTDGMPPAIKLVKSGQLAATFRHDSCRVHGYAIVIAAMHKRGLIPAPPKKVVVDGPLVTKDNADSLLTLQQAPVLLA
jgi:ribose transport system substrate-binding protein